MSCPKAIREQLYRNAGGDPRGGDGGKCWWCDRYMDYQSMDPVHVICAGMGGRKNKWDLRYLVPVHHDCHKKMHHAGAHLQLLVRLGRELYNYMKREWEDRTSDDPELPFDCHHAGGVVGPGSGRPDVQDGDAAGV